MYQNVAVVWLLLGGYRNVNPFNGFWVSSKEQAIRAIGDAFHEISVGVVAVGDGKYLYTGVVFAGRQAAKHLVLGARARSVLPVRE